MTARSIHACLMALLLLEAATASAQGWTPAKPARLVIGFPPGGTTDIVARALGEGLAAALGQSVIVDNRPGAGGNIAAELAARSAPDGHTWFLSSGSNTVAPSLYANLAYDPERDFLPVTLFASVPFALAVHPSLPVRSVKELVALARRRPGELNFASSGVGVPAHLAGELFKSMAGIDIVHVPYKGTTAAMVDLLSGRVHCYFTSFPGAIGYLRDGRLRAIAVSGAQRSAILPALPTVAESGYPGYVAGSWYGLSLPAGTPRAVVDRLHDEVQRLVERAEFRARLFDQGLDPVARYTPERFAEFIRQDIARWAAVVKAAGVKL